MVELGLDEDEGPKEVEVGPKLDVPTPLNGEGGSESEEIEPKGGLGWGTLFHRVGKIVCLMGNLGQRPCN
jgi:hypothetical protein